MKQFQIAFEINDELHPETIANILRNIARRVELSARNGIVFDDKGEPIGTFGFVPNEKAKTS
jgi:hypothetical protein